MAEHRAVQGVYNSFNDIQELLAGKVYLEVEKSRNRTKGRWPVLIGIFPASHGFPEQGTRGHMSNHHGNSTIMSAN
jgi:hypothetical protein